MTSRITTHVVPGQCGECIFCEGACANLRFDKQRREMVVNTIGCRGCGICLPACPATALQQRNSYLGRIEKDVLDWLGQRSDGVPLSCNYCPVVVGELPPSNGDRKDIRLICTGRFEAALAIEALGKGYKGLLLVGCFFEGYPFEKD